MINVIQTIISIKNNEKCSFYFSPLCRNNVQFLWQAEMYEIILKQS